MDAMRQLIAMAFDQGCGVTLKAVLQSDQYQRRLRKTRHRYSSYPPSTDHGAALRAGHVAFGGVLNTRDEASALKLKDVEVPRTHAETEVLLHCLGDHLIDAATAVLSRDIADKAQSWPSLNAKQQSQLLVGLCDDLRHLTTKLPPESRQLLVDLEKVKDITDRIEDATERNRQLLCKLQGFRIQAVPRPSGPVSEEVIHVPTLPAVSGDEDLVIENIPLWLAQATDEYLPQQVLPLQYGQWETSAPKPNCVGMGILLCAVARLTGARYVLARYLQHFNQPLFEAAAECNNCLIEAREQLDLPDVLLNLTRLKRTKRQSLENARRVEDFHFFVCLELANGQWHTLDPFQHNAAPIDPSFELPDATATIGKYADILPGLAVMVDGSDALRNYMQSETDWLKSVLSWITSISRRFEDVPRETGALLEVSKALAGEWQELCRGEPTAIPALVVPETLNTRSLAEAIRQLRGEYFVQAYGLRDGRLKPYWDGTATAHPVFEVMQPSYNLALGVVNQLRCWTDCKIDGSVLLKYSSSKMYWHEAVDLSLGAELPADKLVHLAEYLVRQQRHRHPAVTNKLIHLDRLRAQRRQRNGRCERGTAHQDGGRESRHQRGGGRQPSSRTARQAAQPGGRPAAAARRRGHELPASP